MMMMMMMMMMTMMMMMMIYLPGYTIGSRESIPLYVFQSMNYTGVTEGDRASTNHHPSTTVPTEGNMLFVSCHCHSHMAEPTELNEECTNWIAQINKTYVPFGNNPDAAAKIVVMVQELIAVSPKTLKSERAWLTGPRKDMFKFSYSTYNRLKLGLKVSQGE